MEIAQNGRELGVTGDNHFLVSKQTKKGQCSRVSLSACKESPESKAKYQYLADAEVVL